VFYDLVVATPPGQPDTVIVGGVQQANFRRADDSFHGRRRRLLNFGDDGQATRNQSHVDVRALVFHPRDPDIAFTVLTAVVIRNDGSFVDIRSRAAQICGTTIACQTMLASVPNRIYFMNKGLQTLQFYNVAVDPQDPLRRQIGGLQDNSTIWQDGSGSTLTWKTLFPLGDGTSASGFHPTNSAILFASFQSNAFYTNFRNGDSAFWVRTTDPFTAAAERDTVTASTGRQFITFDKVRPDTQFTGFQHVWRTQSNGGPQAFLEANCKQTGATAGASAATGFRSASRIRLRPAARRTLRVASPAISPVISTARIARAAYRLRRTDTGRCRHAVGGHELWTALCCERRRWHGVGRGVRAHRHQRHPAGS
jgi:hypothetical protein